MGLEVEPHLAPRPERRALRPPVSRVPRLPATRLSGLGLAVDPLTKLVPVRDDGGGLVRVRFRVMR